MIKRDANGVRIAFGVLLALPCASLAALYGYAGYISYRMGHWPSHNDPDPAQWCTVCDLTISGALLLTLLMPAAATWVVYTARECRRVPLVLALTSLWAGWWAVLWWDVLGVPAWFIE